MKTKVFALLIACSLFISSCRKDDDPDPVIVALPYDAKVVGQSCGLPLIEITRNNDSLVASGIIKYSYAANNRYKIINLPDSLSKSGTEFTLDIRSPTAADHNPVCNAAEQSYLNIAIIKAKKK